MRLLTLPSWLDTWGLDYELVPGWEGRGDAFPALPLVVIGHHTATSAKARGDLPTLDILRDGRPDLSGPLSQTGLGRSGKVYVIASGKANHAGAGRWMGLPGGRQYDVRVSARTVGIEAEHPGDDSPWPQVQLDAYDRLAACLIWGLQQEGEAYCGHREWALPAGRKPDPRGIDLPGQRQRIEQLLAAGPHYTAPIIQEDTVFKLLETTDTRRLYALSSARLEHIGSMEQLVALARLGAFAQLDALGNPTSQKVTQAEVDLAAEVLA